MKEICYKPLPYGFKSCFSMKLRNLWFYQYTVKTGFNSYPRNNKLAWIFKQN